MAENIIEIQRLLKDLIENNRGKDKQSKRNLELISKLIDEILAMI